MDVYNSSIDDEWSININYNINVPPPLSVIIHAINYFERDRGGGMEREREGMERQRGESHLAKMENQSSRYKTTMMWY